jgi:predicted DNA-binding transcriptional regulator AlpA
MQLTERDVEIMRFINEFGFCELPQLAKKCGLEKTWMYEIMGRLVKVSLSTFPGALTLNSNHII